MFGFIKIKIFNDIGYYKKVNNNIGIKKDIYRLVE